MQVAYTEFSFEDFFSFIVESLAGATLDGHEVFAEDQLVFPWVVAIVGIFTPD